MDTKREEDKQHDKEKERKKQNSSSTDYCFKEGKSRTQQKEKTEEKKLNMPNLPARLPSHYAKAGKSHSTRKMSVKALEALLAECAAEIYMRGGQRLIPMQPFILVRVVPKELMTSGGIILTDHKQNKPVAEGIVLETYAPYDEEVVVRQFDANGSGDVIGERVKTVTRTCPVKQGDRVIFPYYEGVKHQILGDDYLLIRQSADQIKFPYCQVLGVLDYEGDVALQAKLCDLMKEFHAVTISGKAVTKGMDV